MRPKDIIILMLSGKQKQDINILLNPHVYVFIESFRRISLKI